MAYTFTTLKTAIQDYTQNTESTFVSQLSRFIINTEERILKECQLDIFRKSSQGSATSGNQYLSKPTDFLSQNSLSVINSSRISFIQTSNRATRLHSKSTYHWDPKILC